MRCLKRPLNGSCTSNCSYGTYASNVSLGSINEYVSFDRSVYIIVADFIVSYLLPEHLQTRGDDIFSNARQNKLSPSGVSNAFMLVTKSTLSVPYNTPTRAHTRQGGGSIGSL